MTRNVRPRWPHHNAGWACALALTLGAAMAFVLCACDSAPGFPLASLIDPTDEARDWLMPTSVPSDHTLGQNASILPVQGVSVTILAGSGLRGGTDGPGREAQFDGPMALALDQEGYLLVAEYDSGRIRIVDDQGFVRSWVGQPHDAGLASPPTGPLDHPTDLAVSLDGERIYILDGDGRLLAIHKRARLEYLAGGSVGFRDGPAGQSAFRQPLRLGLGPGGVLYMTDSGNYRIRVYDPAGQVYTLAGSGVQGHEDGPAANAKMASPHALAVGPHGQVYIADAGGWMAEQEDLPACIRTTNANGELVTIAGGTETGYKDGAALEAQFGRPLAGMDSDAYGNIYIADTSNHAVRVLTPQGQVMTIAGTGVYGLYEGPGANAMLGLPVDVLWDGETGLWVADYGMQVLWHIDMAGSPLFSD